MTEYIILRARKGEDPDTWERVAFGPDRDGTVLASSPAQAIRSLTHTGDNTYVAVPARSWKPLAVKVQQATKVTIW